MEQRDAAVALREVRGEGRLELGVRAVEVARERGGQRVLPTERARKLVEIDESELDQVRAEPSAPHDLCPQRLLDLARFEYVRSDE